MAAEEPQPTAQRIGDARPVIRLPRQGIPGAIIAIAAGLLALMLFSVLERQRHSRLERSDSSDATSAFSPPPALVVPPEAMPELPQASISVTPPMPKLDRRPPPPVPVVAPSAPIIDNPPPRPTPTATPAPALSRLSEPAIVLDASTGGSLTAQPGTGGGSGAGVGDDTPIGTTVIRNRSTVMPVGTIMPSVLETPIDSARPGLVRAVVTGDARGFDGKRVLIPRGSRLIGQYDSDVRSGQNRVLVTWTRLIRPDGVAIRIGSPAADALGGAGVPGRVNSFFFQHFASAVLQSALAVGVNLAARPGNGSVVVGLPGSNLGSIGQSLLPSSDLRPKIKVRQGTVMNVFVAHDLDFSGTPAVGEDATP